MPDSERSTQAFRFPFSAEAGEAGFSGEELLHCALLDVALFGEEAFQGFDEGVGVAQGGGDGLLFGERGEGNTYWL